MGGYQSPRLMGSNEQSSSSHFRAVMLYMGFRLLITSLE